MTKELTFNLSVAWILAPAVNSSGMDSDDPELKKFL